MQADIAPQQSGQRCSGAIAKILVDLLKQGQLSPINALRGEVVRTHRRGALLAAFFEQGRHFFVGDARLVFLHYCTTKLVNSTSSTSGPPSFFCTARTSVSASWRSFSLPSRDIIDW